nr:MAG TPA: hypothetical protein [Caudoviricetes sp.]
MSIYPTDYLPRFPTATQGLLHQTDHLIGGDRHQHTQHLHQFM